MQKLILDMMASADVTEEELRAKRVVSIPSGEELSWEYLCYVRTHPVYWDVPTEVLYGSKDALSSYETIAAFSMNHGTGLTVMENGEHWFHTTEQMRFLDDRIRKCENAG